MLVADHPNLRLAYDSFALIAVVRYRNSTDLDAAPNANGVVYAKVCPCDNFVGAALFANDDYDHLSALPDAEIRANFLFQTRYGTGATRSTATGFNDDRVHVVVGQRISSAYRNRVDVDGQLHSLGFTDLYDLSTTGYPAVIGASVDADAQSLEGDLFELVLVRGAVPASIEAISDCLMAKYRPHG